MTKSHKIPLWHGQPPYSLEEGAQDSPFMEIFTADPAKATGSSMLILPGGAYTFLSEKSGAAYGKWLANAGITGFVVNFRLGSDGYRYQAILADALRSLCLVRSSADEWSLDPDRVGVIGTSAGGHLASLLLTRAAFGDLEECQGDELDINTATPALGVLCYPVISLRDPLAHVETRSNLLGENDGDASQRDKLSTQLHVSDKVPPCFIWHTMDDDEVTVENSKVFAEALHAHGVPHELHLYESGPHALALALDAGLHWTNDCIRWLRSHGF